MHQIETWEKKIQNYFKMIHSKFLTQLNQSEGSLKLMLDVMNEADSKKRFQTKIKKLLNFGIGNKNFNSKSMFGEGEGSKEANASKLNINNSVLSSIRKNSVFESDRKSKLPTSMREELTLISSEDRKFRQFRV